MSQFAGFDIRGEAIFGWFSPLMRFPGGGSERSQAEYERLSPLVILSELKSPEISPSFAGAR